MVTVFRDYHWCPGRCGQKVPPRLFACLECWNLLPPVVRQAISSTHDYDLDAHLNAVQVGIVWLRDNLDARTD